MVLDTPRKDCPYVFQKKPTLQYCLLLRVRRCGATTESLVPELSHTSQNERMRGFVPPSGHSRTGHTGHIARSASKLARLANRLPGTNVPGWNFGWPTPKYPDARSTLLIFRLIFPRLTFPRFSLAFRQRRSTQS